MRTIGAFEAKTHLSKLLKQVAQGEQIIIEKHGVPVAKLGPVGGSKSEPVGNTIEALKQMRMKHRLNGVTIRETREEGRR